jgi:hypothetical protein
LLQQLIKLEFWRLGLCKYYVWIDSDSYFIRGFSKKDFFDKDNNPYIFQREYNAQEEISKMAHIPRNICEKRVQENVDLILKFKRFFKNSGPLLAFAGSMPIMWSTTVLRSLNENFLKALGENIYQILDRFPCETQLYGEYLHYSKVIPLAPSPFMFKSFLYADDFCISQMHGEYEYSIAKDYYGICMQSNWTSVKKKRKASARIKRHLNDLLHTVNNLIQR